MTTHQPRVWIEWYFDLWSGHYIVGSVGWGCGLFLFGLAIAWYGNFTHLYVHTTPIYLGVLGTSWVAAWLGWGSRSFQALPNDVRPAFSTSDSEFSLVRDNWIRGTYKNSRALIGFLLLYPPAAIYMLGWMSQLRWLPVEWSQPHGRIGKMLILELLLAVTIILCVSVVVGIVRFYLLVYRLSRLPLIPMLDVAVAKLRRVTAQGLRISVAWSVGVALFIWLFRPSLGPLSLGVASLLGLMGAAAFLLPHLWLHYSLDATKEALLLLGWNAVTTGKNHKPEELWALLSDQASREKYDLVISVGQTRTWLTDPGSFLQALGTWFIPIMTLIVQASLKHP